MVCLLCFLKGLYSDSKKYERQSYIISVMLKVCGHRKDTKLILEYCFYLTLAPAFKARKVSFFCFYILFVLHLYCFKRYMWLCVCGCARVDAGVSLHMHMHVGRCM